MLVRLVAAYGRSVIMTDVVAILGARGFGLPCARRLGKARTLLLGDISAEVLASTADILTREGYRVETSLIDVSDKASVASFAAKAASLGRLVAVVHTAGISPRMGSPERVFAVNLVGSINVMDAFLPHALPGTVCVVIASNAANYAPVPTELESLMALGAPEAIVAEASKVPGAETGLGAYWLSKRCNQLRVQSAAPAWGARGARIVSVSPGMMSTEMIHFERAQGAPVDEAVSRLPVGRIGLPDEIAIAVEWLCSHDAAFVTGTDLLVDGGQVAGIRWAGTMGEDPTDASTQAS